MRRQSVVRQRQDLDLPMTPMIDVVFQLIIFFLCTTRFTPLEGVLSTPIERAGVSQRISTLPPELETPTQLVVKLSGESSRLRIVLNGRTLDSVQSLEETLHTIADIRVDVPVIIDASSEVLMEDVIKVCDLCRKVGLKRVTLATPRR